MKPLIIGSGAREHAIAWKFTKSKRISGLYIAPGNEGTSELGENLPHVDPLDIEHIVSVVKENDINVVFVGPEAPLAAGLIDRLEMEGVPSIGPTKNAARLESSKVFSKQFMIRYNIPTAQTVEFHDVHSLNEYLKRNNAKIVLKKSGLAGGKGVFESEDKQQLLDFGSSILKHDALLAEEFLEGYEISVFAAIDGKNYLLLPPCADFKKAGRGDTGKNTGGMGSICPVPGVSKTLLDTIEETIVNPTIEGMKNEGLFYRGILYFGLMICDTGPKVLEYNVRFGDPETQVLLPLIESDMGNLVDAIIKQELDTFPLRVSDRSSVGVVVASKGYPETYEKRIPVQSLPHNKENELMVFHASTTHNEQNTLVTGGGRCFTVVGIAPDFMEAQMIAFKHADQVRFEGAWFRNDIGSKFFY